jgi:hypothetical protein
MNQKQTIEFRFEEASKILPVHNNTKSLDIFYKGFKLSKDKDKGEVTIYKIYKNYHKLLPNQEMYKWFEQFPFNYVCDMFMVKRNFNKLFVLDRRLVKELDCKDFFILRGEIVSKIKKSLAIVSELE